MFRIYHRLFVQCFVRGKHRVVSLRCGHFFGESCIKRWIRANANKKVGACPECKAVAKIYDVRKHFARKLVALDTDELQRERLQATDLRRKANELESRNGQLQLKLADEMKKFQTALKEINLLKLKLSNLQMQEDAGSRECGLEGSLDQLATTPYSKSSQYTQKIKYHISSRAYIGSEVFRKYTCYGNWWLNYDLGGDFTDNAYL